MFVSCDHVVCFTVISPSCVPTRALSIGFDVKADYRVKDSTYHNSINSYSKLVSLPPNSFSKVTQSKQIFGSSHSHFTFFHHSAEWKDGSFSQTVGKVTQWTDGQHGQVSAYMCIWSWNYGYGQNFSMWKYVYSQVKDPISIFLTFAFALYQVSGKGDVDRKHGLLMRNNHKVAAKS